MSKRMKKAINSPMITAERVMNLIPETDYRPVNVVGGSIQLALAATALAVLSTAKLFIRTN